MYRDFPQPQHIVNMGWLWLVGSLTLQVSFAKEPYKRDYILQKRPMIWCVSWGLYRDYPQPQLGIVTMGWLRLVGNYRSLLQKSPIKEDYPQPQLRIVNMRWLRLVGCLKSQVSFAKEPYKRDYIYFSHVRHTKALSGDFTYGVATISRLLQIICLFCKRAL